MTVAEQQAIEWSARWVAYNPKPLCEAFAPQNAPSEFWCATCSWNEPLHENQWMRSAVAAELAKLGGAS